MVLLPILFLPLANLPPCIRMCDRREQRSLALRIHDPLLFQMLQENCSTFPVFRYRKAVRHHKDRTEQPKSSGFFFCLFVCSFFPQIQGHFLHISEQVSSPLLGCADCLMTTHAKGGSQQYLGVSGFDASVKVASHRSEKLRFGKNITEQKPPQEFPLLPFF